MKYVFLLSLLLVAFACAVKTPAGKIPNGTNKIEISSESYSDSVLFEVVLTYLDQEGFVVNRSDPKRGTILTDYKSKGSLTAIRMIINVGQGKVLFRGEGESQRAGYRAHNQELQYRFGASGVQIEGFVTFEDVVRRFNRRLPNSTLKYLVSR